MFHGIVMCACFLVILVTLIVKKMKNGKEAAEE